MLLGLLMVLFVLFVFLFVCRMKTGIAKAEQVVNETVPTRRPSLIQSATKWLSRRSSSSSHPLASSMSFSTANTNIERQQKQQPHQQHKQHHPEHEQSHQQHKQQPIQEKRRITSTRSNISTTPVVEHTTPSTATNLSTTLPPTVGAANLYDVGSLCDSTGYADEVARCIAGVTAATYRVEGNDVIDIAMMVAGESNGETTVEGTVNGNTAAAVLVKRSKERTGGHCVTQEGMWREERKASTSTTGKLDLKEEDVYGSGNVCNVFMGKEGGGDGSSGGGKMSQSGESIQHEFRVGTLMQSKTVHFGHKVSEQFDELANAGRICGEFGRRPSIVETAIQSLQPCDVASCYGRLPPGATTVSPKTSIPVGPFGATAVVAPLEDVDYKSLFGKHAIAVGASKSASRVRELQAIVGDEVATKYGKTLPSHMIRRHNTELIGCRGANQ
eukprot:GHVS01064620.1.p1 GENE.GHVS01064620.1~~GHVS01064620.1.p1  ORF type:complete len:443 (-),score=100.30 GHVS01064620.1:1634-2962(-)